MEIGIEFVYYNVVKCSFVLDFVVSFSYCFYDSCLLILVFCLLYDFADWTISWLWKEAREVRVRVRIGSR